MEHTFHYLVFTETEQYGDIYHKADADLVIAERDKVIEEQENLIATLKKERDWLAKDRAQAYDDLEKRAQLNIKQEESIRHQKYKRCLGLKEICLMELDNAFRDPCIERSAVKCVLWRKWANRWHYLAQFFKEVK